MIFRALTFDNPKLNFLTISSDQREKTPRCDGRTFGTAPVDFLAHQSRKCVSTGNVYAMVYDVLFSLEKNVKKVRMSGSKISHQRLPQQSARSCTID